MIPISALTPACRFALPKRARVCPRAVVVCAKPEQQSEPEREPLSEEELHFIPVPQAVALAILRSFMNVLDAINKMRVR